MRLFGYNITKRSTTVDKLIADALRTGREVGVSKETMLKLPTVWRCIEIISTSIAGLPVTAKREEGGSINPIDHAVNKLLNVKANSYMTAQTWKELVLRDVVARGNHYSVIVRRGSTPVELLPLMCDDVTVKLRDGQLVYIVERGDNQDIFLQDDILHVKGASGDGICGLSMLGVHRNSFKTALSSKNYIREFFQNNATPKGILRYPSAQKKEVVTATRDAWHRLYGEGGSYSIAVLDGGAEFQTVSLPPADAMYLEVSKYSDKEICNIYGVPMHMVNDLSDAHYNNIESSGVELVKFTLMSWINRLESEINDKLLRESEKGSVFVDFDVNGLMRGDMQTRAEYIAKMIQHKVLNPNEARKIEGLNPYEGGDIYENPNTNSNENNRGTEE